MSFSTATIKAEVRQNTGTGSARAARRENKVPAVIYTKGKGEVHVNLIARDLTLEYQRGRFFSRIIEIDTGSQKINVLPKEVQMHPVKDSPVHADFLGVDAKTRIRVSVPVAFINQDKSPGIKRGGILNAVRRSIDVFCNAGEIPEKFIADVGPLQIGGNIKWHNIDAPKGVEPVIKGRDFTIATVAGRMAEEDKVVTADAAAPAAAAPAAAAAAPAAAKAPEKKGK
jgi:large subunit ribosomal protein L25